MKKVLGITAITAAVTIGATEIWARGELDCRSLNYDVQSLLRAIADKPFMTIDEAVDYRYQYNTGDGGADPLYSQHEVSNGSWKNVVLDIWEEREPHYICQQNVICKYEHREMLGDRIETNCARGDYRPNVRYLVESEVTEAYARLTAARS